MSPGPAVFYVVSQGVRGRSHIVAATLGILSANAIYFALSATSLGALVAGSARFFSLIKWVGAGYLVFLAIKALAAAAAGEGVALNDFGLVPRQTMPRERRIYLGALTLQLSNPKALLLFLALLPQFVDMRRSAVPQMMILAATSMIPEFFILLSYGWLAQRAAQASARFGVTAAMNRWLGWIEGVGLLACATLVLKFNRAD